MGIEAQNPYRSFIVQASAGSGKTYQLSRRFLYLVASGADPSHILTLTFTVKAANEMRARILSDAAALWTQPDFQAEFSHALDSFYAPHRGRLPPPRSPMETAQKILASTQLLKISTIDAIFHEWVRRFPWEAGCGTQHDPQLPHPFRIGEIHEMEAIHRQAWRQLFQPKWAPKECGTLLQEWVLLTGQGPLQLEQQLLAMHRHQTFLWERKQRGEAPFLSHLQHSHHERKTEAEFCASLLPAVRALACQTGQPDVYLAALEKGTLDAILSSRMITQSGGVSGTVFRGKKRESLQDSIQYVESQLQSFLDRKKYETLDVVNHILQQFYEAWQRCCHQLKLQQGLCEFSDLTQACYRIHHNEEAAGATWVIHKSLQHLLMDEFQDTSHLQWSIFEKLMEELLSGANATEDRPGVSSVFVVGDRKQSIYGFREADPYVLTLAREKLLAFEHEELSLDESFRSVDLVCEYVNRVFSGELDPLCPTHRSAAIPLPMPNQGRIVLSELFTKSAEKIQSPLEQEAEFVADQIQQALERQDLVVSRKSSQTRVLTPNDCCILYRNSTHAAVFAEALQKRGIAFRREENQNLFLRTEIQDMVALIRFLVVPTDRIALLTFLRSPMGGVSDREALSFLSASADATAASMLSWYRGEDPVRGEILGKLQKQAFLLPPHQMIRQAIQSFQAEKSYLAQLSFSEARLALRNLEKFLELAFEQEKKCGSSLVGLLQEIEKWQKYGYVHSANVQSEAVTLMTIHKSKGLEFPLVCVVETGESWFKEDRYWLKLKHPQPGLAYVGRKDQQPQTCLQFQHRLEMQAAQQREEAIRLLYVALTRASQYLVISAHEPHSRSEGFYGALLRALPVEVLRVGSARIWEVTDVRCEVPPEALPVPITTEFPLFTRRAGSTLLPDAVQMIRPVAVMRRKTRREDLHPELQALYGSFIHGALQRAALRREWDFERNWFRLVQFTPQGKSLSLSSSSWKEVFSTACSEIRRTCAHPVWRTLFQGAQEVVPEMELLSLEETKWIRARLDVFIEHPTFCWVIEYKTTGDPDVAAHEAQLNLYRIAVARYRPEKSIRCGVWFTNSCSFVEIPAHAGS